MTKYIKSLKELKKIVGKNITCDIQGTDIQEAKLIEAFFPENGENGFFILQNQCEGYEPEEKESLEGYEFSWAIDSGTEYVDVNEELKDLKIRVK